MNPNRSFSSAIVVFCNLPLILLSAEPFWGDGRLAVTVNYAPNSISVGALPQTLLGDLTDPLAGFK